MAAPPLSNTAEGGTNGTTITAGSAGNSGGTSGNFFDAITGTLTFSNVQSRNNLSVRNAQTATPATTRVDWSGLGTITADVWGRLYMWISQLPTTGQLMFLGIRITSAAGLSAQVYIGTTGLIAVQNAAAADIATLAGTVAVALNSWFRFEYRIRSAGASSQFDWWLYKTPDSNTADDSKSVVSGITLGANTNEVRHGLVTNATGNANLVQYMDDFAVSTSGKLGPSAAAPVLPRKAIVLNQAIQRSWTRCQKLTQRKSGLFVPAEWAERLVIA